MAGGGGDIGTSSVDYNLEVDPYLNIEACSWVYPEEICINVSRHI
jgi:hypothetical protein